MSRDQIDIRRPAAAGSFYPADPAELTRTIAQLYSEVDKVALGGRPMALVAPHAGYQYSGKCAAGAFKVLEGEQFDTVVVVSPSHTVFFKGSSVFEGRGYETPLGLIESDRELSERIAEINPTAVNFSAMGHASGSVRGEHALEVQLPFLQIVLGKFKLVAIVMGDQEESSVKALAEVLSAALPGTNSLLVASTDLSHFHSDKKARRLDHEVQNAIEKYDPRLLMDVLESGRGEACGGGPVAAVLEASRRLGGDKVSLIDYSTSGDTTGDFSEVVGYLSAVVSAGKKSKVVREAIGKRQAEARSQFTVTPADQKLLRKIARDAIVAHLNERAYNPPASEALSQRRGAFVTLKLDGQLRGCIGQIRATNPLNQTIADMAVAAAFEDPRFAPLTETEVEKLQYEISILSPLTVVHDFDEIKIGRDGLLIKFDFHSGLLLPQVATEAGWDVVTFLEQTCLKAGLPKNSYHDRNADVFRFSAFIF